MIRIVVMLLLMLSCCLVVAPARSETPTKSPSSAPIKLTSSLIRKGFDFILPFRLIDTNISSLPQLGIVNLSFGIDLSGSYGLVQEQKRRNQLLGEQNDLLKQSLNCQIRHLDFEKMKYEALMRRPIYQVNPDELVVVVADFSSGNPSEGGEIADEIAIQLSELKNFGIPMSIIVGEMKPGVVIRSEEMAQDLGQHFPARTNFVVIWGTMSPQTVGRYRPHITTVQKSAGNQGISNSYTIDLASAELPVASEPEEYRRECHRRLIGATCAAVPSCYVAHEISRDRTPDLRKLYKFLGENEEEVHRLKQDIKSISHWAQLREKHQHKHLCRVSAVTTSTPYPNMIYNEIDKSVMVLLTEKDGKPKYFKNKDNSTCLVYMDVAETTNQQYVDYLNAKRENGTDGATPWLDVKKSEIRQNAETMQFEVAKLYQEPGFGDRCPVIYVNWYGANDYCRWAKKEMPTRDEWQFAAGAGGEGPFPWGNSSLDLKSPQCNGGGVSKYYRPIGEFHQDKSRIGCFDMGGNVSEWVQDWADQDKGWKYTCGGSYQDSPTESRRYQSTATHPAIFNHRVDWIGFRGVIRIPVEVQTP